MMILHNNTYSFACCQLKFNEMCTRILLTARDQGAGAHADRRARTPRAVYIPATRASMRCVRVRERVVRHVTDRLRHSVLVASSRPSETA
jgi:hypothetical protein